ncbi:G-protein coupled receptor 143-like [Aricia agestis]|uniref:G-protein coupled receptor 143-like n=1 Tax=Aricia agestis TaxID=91739 RepID=UPI001C203624|nr:G-protein coupled receptor 143-like [Aricia agestis]
MSDPTIQTFCCHHSGNKEDLAVKIMSEFNTESYNTVCLVSSSIGILGSLYQILPRRDYTSLRLQNFSSSRGRHIIIWLAVADLLASLGVLIRSSLWLQFKNIMPMPDDDVSVLFCTLISAWTQYFYTATWFWTLFYAIDTWNAIRNYEFNAFKYHTFAWGIPAITTGVGLSILYIPDATCHNLTSITSAVYRILPNYCATYLPIAMVMIVNPIIYMLLSKHVELAVSIPMAQFTSKERRLVDALKLKFFLINGAFYLCWLPNLINGLLLWTMWFNMPVNVIITIWYIMAFLNPMQALLNAIVYRRWTLSQQKPKSVMSSPENELNFPDEQSPLLGSEPPRLPMTHIAPTINIYSTM